MKLPEVHSHVGKMFIDALDESRFYGVELILDISQFQSSIACFDGERALRDQRRNET